MNMLVGHISIAKAEHTHLHRVLLARRLVLAQPAHRERAASELLHDVVLVLEDARLHARYVVRERRPVRQMLLLLLLHALRWHRVDETVAASAAAAGHQLLVEQAGRNETEAAEDLVRTGADRAAGRVARRLAGVLAVKVERIVARHRRYERRPHLLLLQVRPVNRREELVPLDVLDAVLGGAQPVERIALEQSAQQRLRLRTEIVGHAELGLKDLVHRFGAGGTVERQVAGEHLELAIG